MLDMEKEKVLYPNFNVLPGDSKKHGGEQKMVTPDGYVFQLKNIDDGVYLPMAYPTDSELDSLLHVEFMSPGSWDPKSEIDDHNDEAWLNEIDDQWLFLNSSMCQTA